MKTDEDQNPYVGYKLENPKHLRDLRILRNFPININRPELRLLDLYCIPRVMELVERHRLYCTSGLWNFERIGRGFYGNVRGVGFYFIH